MNFLNAFEKLFEQYNTVVLWYTETSADRVVYSNEVLKMYRA